MNGIRNIGQLVVGTGDKGPNSLDVRNDGCVIIEGGDVFWSGSAKALPQDVHAKVNKWFDAEGSSVVPGFVDSHTHLVYAGCRANEFSMRCAGATYEEIAEGGGGIRATAEHVAKSSVQDLVEASLPRLRRMLEFGITTVEIKSGYGLSVDGEIKMLKAIEALRKRTPQTLVSTFLGAHVVPVEYKDRKEAYIRLIIDEMLPRIAQDDLATFCDVFCERGTFTPEETERILRAAQSFGMKSKVHAEQLSSSGGIQTGVAVNAYSVDHCEHLTDLDVDSLANADHTVATLLPGATLFLGLTKWAPARKLLDASVPVALSTDCNPGSSNTENIQLVASLGCTRLGMSVHESLAGITTMGAAALGLGTRVGHLRPGSQADLCLLDSPDIDTLVYRFGGNGVRRVMVQGKWIGENE